jgi:murein L,D-transpeptidase YafK
MVKRFLLLAGVSLALAACQQDGGSVSGRSLAPIPPATLALMASKGMQKSDPILVRAYKKEAEMEVWKRGADGRYALLKTYPICRWSGQLGPKVREGDRQTPEGFYTVTPAQMNPNSAYFLSFDTGFPNAYDREMGRTGSALMVHGSCSSRGCFAMTDEAIAEIYAVAREAFAGGQRGFQFQSYPFRMTAQNLARHRYDPHMPFWRNLKEGHDYFEVARQEPKVQVCGRRYVFGAADGAPSCTPADDPQVAEKRARDDREVADLVAKGTPAVRLVYDDGGQHESFRTAMASAAGEAGDGVFAVLDTRPPRRNLGEVSRPEALAMGPREIPMEPTGSPRPEAAPSTALAYAPTARPQAVQTAAAVPATAPAAVAAGPTAVATAAPLASPTLPAEERPLLRRMFSSLMGGAPEPQVPVQAPVQAAASEPAPAPAPRRASPPQRPEAKASSKPAAPSAPQAQGPAARASGVAKPQAQGPGPERRAAGRMSGAQPVLQAGLTAQGR